jgi:hypothetical protein
MATINSSKRLLVLFFCIVFTASLVVSLAAVNHFQAHAQEPSSHTALPGIHSDSTGNWPEFHGDAARDSDQPGETLLNKSDVTVLTQVPGFSYNNLGSMESFPDVYQGIVYVTGMTQTVSGTKTTDVSTMYAINAVTGAIVWSETFLLCATLHTSEWVLSSPATTSGMVNGVLTPEVFVGWGSPDGGGKYGCLYDFSGLTEQLICRFPWPPTSIAARR